MTIPCEICGKNYKGKIGIGVHLSRSHTLEERQKLLVKHLMDLVPTMLATLTVMSSIVKIGVKDEL